MTFSVNVKFGIEIPEGANAEALLKEIKDLETERVNSGESWHENGLQWHLLGGNIVQEQEDDQEDYDGQHDGYESSHLPVATVIEQIAKDML